jgi:hypothetical protein
LSPSNFPLLEETVVDLPPRPPPRLFADPRFALPDFPPDGAITTVY